MLLWIESHPVVTVEQLLNRARRGLERVEPLEAADCLKTGAVLVDIRADHQRERDGVIAGSVFIPRNVLEWRCDPHSPWRNPAVCDPGRKLIVICDEGYQSSLAAAILQELGLPRATDMVGGFRSWLAAGLPVSPAASVAAETLAAYATPHPFP